MLVVIDRDASAGKGLQDTPRFRIPEREGRFKVFAIDGDALGAEEESLRPLRPDHPKPRAVPVGSNEAGRSEGWRDPDPLAIESHSH